MNLRGTEITFALKDGTPDKKAVGMEGPELVKAQGPVRDRVRDILRRAAEREEKLFEMSGLDNRYPDFPIGGVARIVAQEIRRILKAGDSGLEHIVINVYGGQNLEEYQDTFEGYIKHLEIDLGREPYHTVDLIIERPEGLVVIERSNPPYGWALPGGFIDPGEDAQTAARREAKEETNLDLGGLREFGVYDQPGRDPRFETSTTVFIGTGMGEPRSGDDAQALKIIGYHDLLGADFAFDHGRIVGDYIATER